MIKRLAYWMINSDVLSEQGHGKDFAAVWGIFFFEFYFWSCD